ncbi:SMI1/KNR4 family protein [Streptomyces nitrosporeus]|uniref:SMI1/KNR4 family protein n=1 Tax=Streptomyces nitrosporeus TaxID=28894 RepID=UPI00332E9577
MHPAVERLVGLVPSPRPRHPRDWQAVERELGTPVPTDYQQLIEAYGGGLFDETVWILDPACPDEDHNLLSATTERAEVLADLRETEPAPQQIRDTGARVAPWAYVEDSGAYLYWLAEPGQKPDEWTVMSNEGRGPLWEHHDTRCAPFLLAVLTGRAETEYFPELPAEVHTFEANDDILDA